MYYKIYYNSCMDNVKSRGRGRPAVYKDVSLERGSYRIPVTTVAILKNAGGGNICLGIIRAADSWLTSQSASPDTPNQSTAEE